MKQQLIKKWSCYIFKFDKTVLLVSVSNVERARLKPIVLSTIHYDLPISSSKWLHIPILIMCFVIKTSYLKPIVVKLKNKKINLKKIGKIKKYRLHFNPNGLALAHLFSWIRLMWAPENGLALVFFRFIQHGPWVVWWTVGVDSLWRISGYNFINLG